MVKKEVADLWVAALRSGKYKQGRGYLRREIRGEMEYCCLGVLCDISGVGEWYGSRYQETKSGLHSDLKPEEDVREWSGLWSVSGFPFRGAVTVTDFGGWPVTASGLPVNLVTLNDQGETTFEQIANLIEKHYKYL